MPFFRRAAYPKGELMQSVASIKDERIVHARSLVAAAGRRASHECLLFGERQITWALGAGIRIESIFVVKEAVDCLLVKNFEQQGISVFEISPGIMKKITATNFVIPVVGVAHINNDINDELPDRKILLVFDHVMQRKNLGAMIHNAQSFGVQDIVVADGAGCDLYYRSFIESSHGAVFTSSIHAFDKPEKAVVALKNKGYQIVISAPHLKARGSIFDLQQELSTALVMGDEGIDVHQDFIDAAKVIVPSPHSLVRSLDVNARDVDIENLATLRLRMVLALLSEHLNKKITQHPAYVAFAMVQLFQQELARATALSLSHIFLLMQLISDRVISFDTIGTQFFLLVNEVRNFIQPLVERGFIERFGYASFEGIRITIAGEKFLESSWLIIEYVESLLFKNLSSEECLTISSSFEKISKNIKKIGI